MPTRIEMYAIRDVTTGGYLPAPQGRGGRGGSHMEPVRFPAQSPTNRSSVIPRMWATKAAAKTALSTWLKGKVNCYRDSYDEDIWLEETPHRLREHMEIIPVIVELP